MYVCATTLTEKKTRLKHLLQKLAHNASRCHTLRSKRLGCVIPGHFYATFRGAVMAATDDMKAVLAVIATTSREEPDRAAHVWVGPRRVVRQRTGLGLAHRREETCNQLPSN